ncbi:MAG: glycoside hydrolase family 127 protein, partial [Kiritimatiellaeota bacterium]|nr:glycoside hydrolase family 127 protein [Kiritimatiellota bacterium]
PKVRAEYSGDQIAVGYICWTQIIEGLVELYRATHNERYLKLAEEIATNTFRHPKQHSHGFVTALRGILELYRETHDAKWLAKAETEWEGILSSGNLLPQGALPEVFKPMNELRSEGCSEADWLRFNLALWDETRKPRYLENAELTLFNEFFFNQFHTGDYGHHRFSADGIGPEAARAWWCCTFHGLRAFPDIAKGAFHADAATLCYDLPVDGDGIVTGLTIRADTTLAQDATVSLNVRSADDQEHVLRIRKPGWASKIEVTLHRKPLAGVLKNGALEIKRRWTSSEILTVTYSMTTRLLTSAQHPGHVAFLHGPWLLGVNEESSPTFFDEPYQHNRVIVPAATNGVIQLEPAADRYSRRGPMVAAAAHLALPYLPGGYPCQKQTVTLRPMSEHTLIGDTTPWVLWFELKK